jgi:ABC-type antimicrobial peptide transport system permease subunit
MAVRLALGAGRGRLIRQLLTESLVLAVAGGGAGLLLVRPLVDLLVTFLPSFLTQLDASPDWRVLGFLAGTIAGVVVLF